MIISVIVLVISSTSERVWSSTSVLIGVHLGFGRISEEQRISVVVVVNDSYPATLVIRMK